MQRLYSPDLDLGAKDLAITDTDRLHQLQKVLRSQSGDLISLFCDDGYEYVYEIASLQKRKIDLNFKEKRENHTKNTRNITLYQALPNKWDKAELIVQKCTEIGVSQIVFFPADRSQLREIPDKKMLRMQKIAIEASEQSGRSAIPGISLGSNEITHDSVVMSLLGSQIDGESLRTKSNLSLHIGPEGGWSPEEEKKFQEQKCILWKAGASTLRTETAAICGCFYLINTK